MGPADAVGPAPDAASGATGSGATGTPRATVLLARPRGRGGRLAELLAPCGIRLEHHPLVAIEPVDGSELTRVLEDLAHGRYTDLVVTSRTTVDVLLAAAERAAGASAGIPVATGTRVVAVGSSTADALTRAGIPPQLVAEGSGAALVRAMPPADGAREVLYPTSQAAAGTVEDGLAAAGYRVHRVAAYRPRALDLPSPAAARLAAGDVDAIVLTSPMIARLAAAHPRAAGTAVVVIGGPTAAAATAAGLSVSARAATPDDAGLAAAVLAALGLPSPEAGTDTGPPAPP